ncbi:MULTISPECIES: AMP-binding protein [Sphingobium]|uniref:AMP-binding protein n=1 Tax=Sphingobium sp. MI1205 TaxID=407020 RepID=UPI00078326BE|nr:AMP-binding protein [Sphingobium sp. MI1205]
MMVQLPEADWLGWHTARQPDKAALHVVGGPSVSYAVLDDRASRLACWLRGLGLREGDTIGLLLDNDARTVEMWWAARRAGLYFVPLGTRLKPAEIVYILRDSGARALVAAPAFADLAASARGECGTEGPAHWIMLGGAREGWTDLDGQVATMPPTPFQPSVTGREIIYSSGTTGRPKGIRRDLAPAAQARVIPAFEQKLRAACALDDSSIYLSVAPLYHATGRYLMRLIESGGTNVILPHFDPAAALRAIANWRVTHSQWVPTMFTRLLALPLAERTAYDLSSHRVALHAAAPCPIDVKRAMIDWWGPILSEYYGGSENAGVTFITSTEWLEHPGSVGRSITGPIHILDEEDGETELPPGTIGLIYFEGGVPFRYIGDQDAPAGAPDGYATYGDLGHVDRQGYLFISDRRSDLIIRGGVNIYPREVEMLLEAHPAVREVAVIGLPDPEYGQRVAAIICPRKQSVDPEQLKAILLSYCREHLASIKSPSFVDFIHELPRSENGKLLKRLLRDHYASIS